jgi:hypothetical protein
MMFGAQLNIKAKEYSLQEVLVLLLFIVILRQLQAENKTLTTKNFTNKTANDNSEKKELQRYARQKFHQYTD